MTPMFEDHSFNTPSKQQAAGITADSPSWNSTESPSARLLRDIGLQTIEYHRDLHNRLDQRALEAERAHVEALAAASVEHERVRRAAERAQQWVELEAVKERQKQEEEESQELLRERHETVEREIARKRRELQDVRQLEERKRAAEEAARQAEVEQEQRRQEEEMARREAMEREERQKRIEAARARESQAVGAAKAVPTVPAPIVSNPQVSKQAKLPDPVVAASGLVTTMASRKASHEQYVKLHQRLKEMRRYVMEQVKQDTRVKSRVGDMRREIKKSVGQLTGEKGANRPQMQKIRQILIEASSMTQCMVDVRQFLISRPGVESDGNDCQIPGVFIYLFNILSKNIINQFIDEAGVMPKTADPIGVVAVSMFAQAEFRWKGVPLIDILLAKFHVVCPILWGVYGDEKTEGGRKALGWWREAPGGPWVTEQRHSERMTGLGAGFAALSLRDFSKSKSTNPFPPSTYWHAMACIVNTPPSQVTQTHFIVLKAMIENYIPRFIGYYGQAAKAALRKAIVEFPQQSPKSIGASGLSTLTATLKRDLHLSL